jgi:hypothetical protein
MKTVQVEVYVKALVTILLPETMNTEFGDAAAKGVAERVVIDRLHKDIVHVEQVDFGLVTEKE